ncbi:MAG TPA: YkyA family protein [Candidatus Salinicoccus stercoripullorum]|uniref:YkyA family protein n=1 Tax=Candidatus Salinicoccus stercoripullorum TaxID=2838756 RepID=A0A9D1QGQ3_9STAP|nr:YkyA family protein [Candidatus Salinicoccus stercoripullorum]
MRKMIAGLGLAVLFVAGCSSDEDELLDFYNAFQETVEVEKEIETVSEEFNSLENEKGELQESLQDASEEELPEISSELVENTDARIDQLDAEAGVMGESRSSMETSTQYIEEISNETNRDKAESLVEVMDARYQTHGDMIESYKSVLESEKEVFEYLGEEDVSQDEVDERLNSLNGQYEKVEETSAAFSEETGKVNELKKEIEDLIEG